MVVSPGKNASAAWRTNRVGAETVVETHATLGNTIEMGRAVDPAAIATHRMRSVVVGHDKNNIWLASAHALIFTALAKKSRLTQNLFFMKQ